jgi:hypothetical protein
LSGSQARDPILPPVFGLRVRGFSMPRLMVAILIVLAFGVAQCNSAPARDVQGFYQVGRLHSFYDFYRQYPYTLFGYPNYNWNYYPLYKNYPACDFVWGKRNSKTVQHGTWTCR